MLGVKVFSQEFKYYLLSPAELFGEKNFSKYYWDGNETDFKNFCFAEAFKALKKHYGNSAFETPSISQDIKDEEELKNNIYIRVNISRMQLSYELFGTENSQYSLRTTGGIEFFNTKTGEVYFSKIYTIIQPKQVLKKKNEPLDNKHEKEFYELFKNNIHELYDYLFSKAKDEYKPGLIKANIVKTLSDFKPNKTGVPEATYIINRGRLQGLAERQQYRFTNSKNFPEDTRIRVVELQDNYSIVSIISKNSFSIKDGEEIYRAGGTEISQKFPLRIMVSLTEILDNTQIDNRYQVDPGFITQIVHDNFGDNSSFQMLPYGSIAEQQFEASKIGEKEEEVIGNRQRPDIYVKCIISKAYVYSTTHNDGEYLKLVVAPLIIFYDANMGNVLYTSYYEEESLQTMIPNEREANISEQFEILTKNAIYEVTKKAKKEFTITETSGTISRVAQNDIELKLESGKLSVGTVFRVFKKGEKIIDPITNKELGFLLTYIGNIKTKEASGSSGKAISLFTNDVISSGDVLKANSSNITKGSIIVQLDETNINTEDGKKYTSISPRSVILNSMRSLAESSKFLVLLPSEDLNKLKQEKLFLESGHFKSSEDIYSVLEPQVKINSEMVIFPSEIKSDKDVKVNVGFRFTVNDFKTKEELLKKGQKQTLPLKGSIKDKVVVGLSEKDHSKYYLGMCYSIGLNLSTSIFEELQKTLK